MMQCNRYFTVYIIHLILPEILKGRKLNIREVTSDSKMKSL